MQHNPPLSIEFDPLGTLEEIDHSVECAEALCDVAMEQVDPGDIKMLALLDALSGRILDAREQLKKAMEPLTPVALANVQNALAALSQGGPHQVA